MEFTGTIKAMHLTYGFVRADSGIDIFFLPTEVDRAACPFKDLKPGDLVSFDTFDHPRGLRGMNIRKITPNAGTSAA